MKALVLILTLIFAIPAFAEPTPRLGREAAAAYLRADQVLYPRPPRRYAKAKAKPKLKAKAKAWAKKTPPKSKARQKIVRKKVKVPGFSGKLARTEIPSAKRRPSSDGLNIKLKKNKKTRR